MQHLLKKINYYNTPFHKSDSYSPFELVLSPLSSSRRTSITNALNCSPIENASLAVRQSTSWLSSTSSTSTPSPSSYNRNASTSNPSPTQDQGRTATTSVAQGSSLLPVHRGHTVHHSQAPTGPHHARGLQKQGRSQVSAAV